MMVLYILLGYIAHIFIARWLNKVAYSMNSNMTPYAPIWFVPIIPIIVLLFVLLANVFNSWWDEYWSNRSDEVGSVVDWFKGKHWNLK